MTCIRCRVVDRATRRREVVDRSRFLRRRHQLPSPIFDLDIATEDCLATPSRPLDRTYRCPSLILISTAEERRVPAIPPSTISSSTTSPVSLRQATMDSSRPYARTREDIVDPPVPASQPKLDSLPIRRTTRRIARTATPSPPSITQAISDTLLHRAPPPSHPSILLLAPCLPTTISPSSLLCSTRRGIFSPVRSRTTRILPPSRMNILSLSPFPILLFCSFCFGFLIASIVSFRNSLFYSPLSSSSPREVANFENAFCFSSSRRDFRRRLRWRRNQRLHGRDRVQGRCGIRLIERI